MPDIGFDIESTPTTLAELVISEAAASPKTVNLSPTRRRSMIAGSPRIVAAARVSERV